MIIIMTTIIIIIIITTFYNLRLRQIQYREISLCRAAIIIASSRHLTNHFPISAVYLTKNLQISNLILLATSNSIRQSTCLIQLDGDLPCNQVGISCLN